MIHPAPAEPAPDRPPRTGRSRLACRAHVHRPAQRWAGAAAQERLAAALPPASALCTRTRPITRAIAKMAAVNSSSTPMSPRIGPSASGVGASSSTAFCSALVYQ